MKKYILLLVVIIGFLFNCSKKIQSTDFQESDEKNDYDKHQFFEDLKPATRDDLAKIIEQADSVIAYNWNGNNGSPANTEHYIVDAYGKFDTKITKQFKLLKLQIQGLKNILTEKSNYEYEGSTATCFLPHIAFVYYRNNKITGQSNVCFLCEGVKNIPKHNGSLSEKGTKRLKNFCKSIGLNIIDDISHTNKGRKK